uniref:Uncharacterized protein n=1 Tax=Strongyloides stercoralis TaxID=6248 RepID=A0AAF5I3C9_STRER
QKRTKSQPKIVKSKLQLSGVFSMEKASSTVTPFFKATALSTVAKMIKQRKKDSGKTKPGRQKKVNNVSIEKKASIEPGRSNADKAKNKIDLPPDYTLDLNAALMAKKKALVLLNKVKRLPKKITGKKDFCLSAINIVKKLKIDTIKVKSSIKLSVVQLEKTLVVLKENFWATNSLTADYSTVVRPINQQIEKFETSLIKLRLDNTILEFINESVDTMQNDT